MNDVALRFTIAGALLMLLGFVVSYDGTYIGIGGVVLLVIGMIGFATSGGRRQ